MLLILEILLTIAAWRKGWKSRALLPMGFVLFIAFVIGLSIGVSGTNVESTYGVLVLLDLLGVVSLIVMASVAPKSAAEVTIPQPSEPVPAVPELPESQS
jgi:hypothetical protein